MQSPSNKFWGPRRVVEVHREPSQALGIAIVGGKVDLSICLSIYLSIYLSIKVDLTGGRVTRDTSDTVTGIFIKSVLADSPAGRTGQLATGDRIVEVIQ